MVNGRIEKQAGIIFYFKSSLSRYRSNRCGYRIIDIEVATRENGYRSWSQVIECPPLFLSYSPKFHGMVH